jgi:chaperone required for assembly of F1-ATPase
MSDDLANDIFPKAGEPIDPVAMARRDLQKSLPKRFYKEVGIEARPEGFALLIDGKPAKTPAKNVLAVSSAALGEAIAEEWRAQTDYIDPSNMPLTRISNSAIDGVATQIAATADEVAKYAGSDLVCYRAGEPRGLVEAQAEVWDPILAFARETLGARFVLAEGVMFVEQPEQARQAVHAAVHEIGREAAGAAFRLAALHVMTTLTGSALIAMAVAKGALDAETAWRAAHVDEDFQMQIWGKDEEALSRRSRRWLEMEAAAKLWRLS